ncbi:adenine phosphoribosyltransferase [Prochlorococcus sp. AH-736-K09]|nr:adenine phosphoribosyltransferase [Prochlorococcus sp. AH-736-K09]
MLQEELKKTIKDYPNFPSEGIIFKDLLPVFENPKLFQRVIDSMSKKDLFQKAEALIAIDARGFIFGSAIAFNISKPLIFARKPGKLPGDLISGEYELEYGKNSLSIQKESIKNYSKFAIVDDLLATGGTVSCVSKLLVKNNKQITGLSVLVELQNLNGRKSFDFQVESEIKF